MQTHRVSVSLFLCTVLALPAAATPAHENQARDVGHLSLLLGARSLDEDDWSPVEDQFSLGAEFDWTGAGSALGFEVGLSGSAEDDHTRSAGVGVDVEVELLEAYGGVRWSFGEEQLRPYVGGGLSYVEAQVEAEAGGASASDDDGSVGLYVHGGFQLDVSRHVIVGLDARALLGTDLDLAGASGDADYLQLAALVGLTL